MKKQGVLELNAHPFTVRKLTADEVRGYLVEYPDVPLCQSDGETIEEAIANGVEALGRKPDVLFPGWQSIAEAQFRPRLQRHIPGTHRKPCTRRLMPARRRKVVSLNLFDVEAVAKAAGRYESPSKIGTRHRKSGQPTRRDNSERTWPGKRRCARNAPSGWYDSARDAGLRWIDRPHDA